MLRPGPSNDDVAIFGGRRPDLIIAREVKAGWTDRADKALNDADVLQPICEE